MRRHSVFEVKTLSKIRICVAFLLAPVIAGIVTFLVVVGLWYGRLNVFLSSSDPDPVDGAISLSAGVTLVAFFATFGAAVPIVTNIAKRGSLSFKQVVLVGAAIGQASVIAIAAGILILQTITGHLSSSDVSKLWYGVYVTFRASVLGVAIGGSTAAACWVVGVWATEWDQDRNAETPGSSRGTVKRDLAGSTAVRDSLTRSVHDSP